MRKVAQELNDIFEKNKMGSIVALCPELVEDQWGDVHDNNANLLFVNSRYSGGGSAPGLIMWYRM